MRPGPRALITGEHVTNTQSLFSISSKLASGDSLLLFGPAKWLVGSQFPSQASHFSSISGSLESYWTARGPYLTNKPSAGHGSTAAC